MLSFSVSISLLKIFYTDLSINKGLLFLHIRIHFFFKFFKFLLHLLNVLVMYFFELLFLQSLAYISQNSRFLSIIDIIIISFDFDIFFDFGHDNLFGSKWKDGWILDSFSILNKMRHFISFSSFLNYTYRTT